MNFAYIGKQAASTIPIVSKFQFLSLESSGQLTFSIPVIFFAIKPTPVLGVVPNGKKYLFFPYAWFKIPNLRKFPNQAGICKLIFMRPSHMLFTLGNKSL